MTGLSLGSLWKKKRLSGGSTLEKVCATVFSSDVSLRIEFRSDPSLLRISMEKKSQERQLRIGLDPRSPNIWSASANNLVGALLGQSHAEAQRHRLVVPLKVQPLHHARHGH